MASSQQVTSSPTSHRAAFRTFVVLAIVGGYMLSRAAVYAHFPVSDSLDWYRRDAVMTFPRLIFFLASLAVSIRWWTREEMGFHFRG